MNKFVKYRHDAFAYGLERAIEVINKYKVQGRK
jgi:hypothetical protein